METQARRFFVSGRVQGVGFRFFAEHTASSLGIGGYVRNLSDGRVEVYAVGPEEKLDGLAGLLHHGPRWADVHGVTQEEAAVERHSDLRSPDSRSQQFSEILKPIGTAA